MSRLDWVNQYRNRVNIMKHFLWKFTGNADIKKSNSVLHSSAQDISITFWQKQTPGFRRLNFQHPAFATLPTVTKKTRIYHRLTTATDAMFIGNPERTYRSTASHLTVGSCAYSERIFFLRRSSLFVHFLYILKICSFSMRLSEGNFTHRV